MPFEYRHVAEMTPQPPASQDWRPATAEVATPSELSSLERSPQAEVQPPQAIPTVISDAGRSDNGQAQQQAPEFATADVSERPRATAPRSAPELQPASTAEIIDPKQPIGPGHYVQSSGWQKSGDCGENIYGGLRESYTLRTPPILPGFTITNFRYELRGDHQSCERRIGEFGPGQCEVLRNDATRKAVSFRLKAQTQYCIDSGNPNLPKSTPPGRVVMLGEMVFHFDVQ